MGVTCSEQGRASCYETTTHVSTGRAWASPKWILRPSAELWGQRSEDLWPGAWASHGRRLTGEARAPAMERRQKQDQAPEPRSIQQGGGPPGPANPPWLSFQEGPRPSKCPSKGPGGRASCLLRLCSVEKQLPPAPGGTVITCDPEASAGPLTLSGGGLIRVCKATGKPLES